MLHFFRPPGGNFHHSEIQDRVHRFFSHIIPAYTIDTISRLTGHKPILVRLITKMHRGMAPLEWFANRQWIWANDNVVTLSEEFNATDQKWFPCRVNNLDWHEYLINYMYTLRKHVLKYDDSTIDACKLRMKRLTLVFELVKGLAMLAWVLLAVTCFSRFFM